MERSGKKVRIFVAALVVCALVGGCANLQTTRIDPTGEHLFVQGPVAATPQFREHPYKSPCREDDAAVTLHPGNTVAPVGSEVILVAGVAGADNYLRTNRRLEWSLSPGGMGQFVAVGRNGPVDLMVGDFNRPRKIDNTFAIGSTSRKQLRLTRGTPDPGDDVRVLRGQGWISVSSPAEGTSHVMVYAPSVPSWACHTRTASIHWIDAAWQLPPPAINPAGAAHTLTTTVVRHTDQEPCEGWLVRYEIVDGPAAGFSPDGTMAIEVTTDSAGQASAEIIQREPKPGVNKIAVQIIRPAAKGGPQGKCLVVGGGYTTKTWTAPDLAIRKSGPSVAGLKSQVTYEIEVSNPGDMPAEDVVVTDELPETLAYIAADPPAEKEGEKLRWTIGQLGAGEARSIQLNCLAMQRGSVVNCADATGKGDLKASDSATTSVETAELDVQTSGPARAAVGGKVTFAIVITNRSQVPTGELMVKDRFDAGLEHAAATSPIERELRVLQPGASQQLNVIFQVTKPGRLCHRVEVSDAEGIVGRAEGCVVAAAAPSGTPSPGAGVPSPKAGVPADGGGAAAPKPPARPSVSVTKIGPKQRNVDQTARFTIDVANDGNQTLTNVKVVDDYDAALYPNMASEGNKFEDNRLVWIIDRLPAGRVTQLEVHCKCLKEAARACNRVTVTTLEGVGAEAEACLAISPAPGRLNIEVGDLLDPVRLGKELTYEVRISNDETTPDRQVVLVATVPPGMMPVPIGTSGPRQVRFTIKDQTVRFDPLPQIDPGEKLSYRIRVGTRRPGTFHFRIELTSQNQPQPTVAEESTEVFE